MKRGHSSNPGRRIAAMARAEAKPERLPVLFRIGRDKAAVVTAVFPSVPFDYAGNQVSIYEHIGQHGGASWDWFHSSKHRRATPEEYAPLLAELRDIYERKMCEGDTVFELVPVQRSTAKHREAFREVVRKMRNTKEN